MTCPTNYMFYALQLRANSLKIMNSDFEVLFEYSYTSEMNKL